MSPTHFPPLMWMLQSCTENGKIQKEKTKSMKTSSGKHLLQVQSGIFTILKTFNRSIAQVCCGFLPHQCHSSNPLLSVFVRYLLCSIHCLLTYKHVHLLLINLEQIIKRKRGTWIGKFTTLGHKFWTNTFNIDELKKKYPILFSEHLADKS